MKKNNISRRDFNLQLALASLGLPLLPSLMSTAYAQTATAPKRLILLRSKNGILHANCAMNSRQAWNRLKVLQNDPILSSAAVRHSDDVYYLKLSDLAYTSNIIENSGLKNFKSKINVIKGLDLMTRHAHNSFNFLCSSTINNPNANEYYGPAFTYSMDEVLEKKFIDKAKFKVPVLRVLPQVNQGSVISDQLLLDSLSYFPDEGNYYGDIKRIPYLGSIRSIYQTLFAGATSTPTTPTPTTNLGQLIRTQVLARSQMMAQKRTLSSVDKSRIQNFMDTFSGIPVDATNSGGSTGTVASSCNNGSGLNITTDLGITQNYQKTMDLVVQALACQTSQVAVIGIGDSERQMIDGGWHTITHESHFSPTIFWKYEGFVAEQVTYLVNKLSTTLDVDGSSLLDNTLVVWSTEHSTGYHHEDFDMPIMTIGGANLNMQNGYYIDYRKRNPANTAGDGPFFYVPLDGNETDTDRRALGRPYNDLLVTLFQALGAQPSVFHAANLNGKYGSFGNFGNLNAGFGEYSYPVTGSFSMSTGKANDLFKKVYRSVLPSDSPLPFLFKG